MNGLLIAGAVFAAIAALIHVYIWVLESITWSSDSTRRTFGVRTREDADLLKPLAFNQGFYNLFLALGTAVGLVLLLASGAGEAGFAVALFALLSMVLAAVVLVTSNPRMLRAALVQGAPPLVAVVLLITGAASAG